MKIVRTMNGTFLAADVERPAGATIADGATRLLRAAVEVNGSASPGARGREYVRIGIIAGLARDLEISAATVVSIGDAPEETTVVESLRAHVPAAERAARATLVWSELEKLFKN